MGKNLIPIIAKELGLEMEEEFRIANDGGFRFKFIPQDLLLCADDEEDWYGADEKTIISLIIGDAEIIKLPFKPVSGERYYTFTDDWDITWVDCEDTFFDSMCKKLNIAYRTQEEAIKARPAKYKELTGKEWNEDEE